MGKMFGPYELLGKKLQQNGNVHVWKASKDQRKVVLKIFDDVRVDESLAEKAEREKQASLNHPSIVQYNNVGIVAMCRKCKTALVGQGEIIFLCPGCSYEIGVEKPVCKKCSQPLERISRTSFRCPQCKKPIIEVKYDLRCGECREKLRKADYRCDRCQKNIPNDNDNIMVQEYIDMEFIDGLNLEQYIAQRESKRTQLEKEGKPHNIKKGGGLRPEEALSIVTQIAQVLSYAHTHPVNPMCHLDMKPSNIMICGGAIRGEEMALSPTIYNRTEPSPYLKVIDWGLAKMRDDQKHSEADEQYVYGNPHYMPPEQWESMKKAGNPSDIWSLGCVLYYLLTGKHPYHEIDSTTQEGQDEIKRKINSGNLAVALDLDQVPARAIKDVIRFCLQRLPQDRPTGEELARMINFLLEPHRKEAKKKNYESYRCWIPFLKYRMGKLLEKSPEYKKLPILERTAEKPTSYEALPPPIHKDEQPLYMVRKEGEEKRWGEGFRVAYQPDLKRDVIVKDHPYDDRVYQRLERAVRLITQKLSRHGKHPDLYDFFRDKQNVYLVFRYQEGEPLDKHIAKRRASKSKFSQREIHEILSSILELLDLFHQEELVMRTLAPESILYHPSSDRVPYPQLTFLNYGLVKSLVKNAKQKDELTMVGEKPMPPDIAPPELTLSKSTDIWTVGLVGYELVRLQKRDPRQEEKIAEQESLFYGVIDKALEKEPSARYKDAQEMLTALDKIKIPVETKKSVL